jgi:serine protease SohB
MHYLAQFLIFFAQTITIAATIILILIAFIAVIAKAKQKAKDEGGSLLVKNKNDYYKKLQKQVQDEILPDTDIKALLKAEKKQNKNKKKSNKKNPAATDKKNNIFIINFNGDIRASAVKSLTQEISAILLSAKKGDQVFVKLESGGGHVHQYGLAANQLQRVRDAGFKLTIAVDRVAASGGYMMAVVADTLLAAPFAIVGSIGVIAQIPNFHRWLDQHKIDFEQLTAGKYKRTLTMLGKNDSAGRDKMQQDLEQTHKLFTSFIKNYRPKLDFEKIATGEYWYGTEALKLGLVDDITNSEDWLLKQHSSANLYNISYQTKQKLSKRLGQQVKTIACHLGISDN